jgi:dihydrolipoamide dehydrogenase
MHIIIIGAGPGGYETALEAASKGVRVTIISDGPVGGTCLNEGCIPTKALCHYAELKDEFSRTSDVFGAVPAFDFEAVRRRKQATVEQLRAGVEGLLSHKLIRLVYGHASLAGGHSVRVGDETIEGDAVILATGSVPALLPVEGASLPGILGSKEILDIDEIPARLCIIGGGVIGLEFASIFRSFGSEVTVLEYCRDILPRFDQDLSRRLKQRLSKRGISIETSACVTGIAPGWKVSYTKKDETFTVEADKVLMAVGRKPALGSLNLEEAGIEFTPKGVKVDGNMQTSVPGIYAVGDLVGGMMLAHAATFQGRRALHHILGETDGIDFSVVPAAVFTSPQAATVGLSEEECKEKGIAVKCLKSFYRANGKAVSMDATDGYCKIVTEAGSGRVLGCHMLGAQASELVQQMSDAVAKGMTARELKDIIHAHPTLSELLQSALSQAN